MQRLSGGPWHVAVALALCSLAVTLPVTAQQSMPTSGQHIGGAAASGPLRTPSDSRDGTVLGLSAGGSWSDNIERTAAAEEDGTIATVGVLVGHHQETRRFITSIDANVAYEHYMDDNFDGEVVGGAAAGLTAHLVPDRFLWVLEDNFGQATSDPFAAPTPETRENINVFTTGPDLLLGAGGATLLHLSGRYTNTQYETSPVDSKRYTALVALVRRLSQASSISLNLSGAQVTLDDASLGSDYDQYEGYLHFETEGARTILSLDAGYTALDIGDESPGGVLVRASATRRLSPSSSVSLSLGSQFSDSAELFRLGQQRSGTSLDTSSALTTNDPLENRFVSLSYDFMRNRTAFGFSVEYSDEDYESADSTDRKLTTWGAYASRRLTPMLELRVFADYEIEEFEGISFEDKELEAGAFLNWQVGRMTSVRLQYNRFDRQSTLVATEYKENRVSLFFTWTPIGSQ